MPIKLGTLRLNGPFVQAPLAGITDAPFRTICRRFHDGLMYTEMVSAEALCRSNPFTLKYARIDEDHHPIGLQLIGNDPDRMAQAAKLAEDIGADTIDINAGCPEARIMRGGAGGALLKDLGRLRLIAMEVSRAVDVPVSVKTRIGFGRKRIGDIIKVLEGTGIDFLTCNGYLVTDMFRGSADWQALRNAVDKAPFPVIANGGASSEEGAIAMLKMTGAKAVMIGRAVRGRPEIVGNAVMRWKGETPMAMTPGILKRTIFDHAMLENEMLGERTGIPRMRKHIVWYLKGHGLRYRPFATEIQKVANLKDIEIVLEKAVDAGLKKGLRPVDRDPAI